MRSDPSGVISPPGNMRSQGPGASGGLYSFGGKVEGGGGNEGTKLCNQRGLVHEISLHNETCLQLPERIGVVPVSIGSRSGDAHAHRTRGYDVKVPEEPLKLRLSSPGMKERCLGLRARAACGGTDPRAACGWHKPYHRRPFSTAALSTLGV